MQTHSHMCSAETHTKGTMNCFKAFNQLSLKHKGKGRKLKEHKKPNSYPAGIINQKDRYMID